MLAIELVEQRDREIGVARANRPLGASKQRELSSQAIRRRAAPSCVRRCAGFFGAASVRFISDGVGDGS
jgi:hypothetical protein